MQKQGTELESIKAEEEKINCQNLTKYTQKILSIE